MIGAIAGDIIGSVYEVHPVKTKDFPLFNPQSRFTDDTVLTVAIAQAIMEDKEYLDAVRDIGRRYPNCGYGGSFYHWLFSDTAEPYNSWGNGAAMRVSPVGFAYTTIHQVLSEAKKTAEMSHNHPEGIKGAQATALAVFLARTTHDKDVVRREIESRFSYNLNRTINNIRPFYHFDITCPGTVPEAVIAFLESASYEDAIRNAVSLGGDSDTLACITGGIAHAFYDEIPDFILSRIREILPADLWKITKQFCDAYSIKMSSITG